MKAMAENEVRAIYSWIIKEFRWKFFDFQRKTNGYGWDDRYLKWRGANQFGVIWISDMNDEYHLFMRTIEIENNLSILYCRVPLSDPNSFDTLIQSIYTADNSSKGQRIVAKILRIVTFTGWPFY